MKMNNSNFLKNKVIINFFLFMVYIYYIWINYNSSSFKICCGNNIGRSKNIRFCEMKINERIFYIVMCEFKKKYVKMKCYLIFNICN